MRVAKLLAVALFVLPLLTGSPASADETPAPWVGRVSRVEGNLAIRALPAPGATQPCEWCDSVGVNDPVAAGMSVRTGPQSRAVLRSGAESIVLASATELDLAQLDSSGTQIVLRRGRIGVRLSQLDPAHSIEIDIPRGGVWLLTPGEYDITAGDAQTPARIATLDGRARFVGKGTDKVVATGSAVLLSGSDPLAANPNSANLDSATPDALIAWWRGADPAGSNEEGMQALRYVSPEITGYAALDANGSWQTIADYGAVWFPKSVPADWAPYRDGHWRWVAPWGWTWIDDMEWGFATSHYGRWARIGTPEPGNERWGWVPGKQAAHPAYAPAVVAFLGTAGVGLSYPDAFGPAVAWFPLAPGEIYWPGYTGDIEAIRRLNPDTPDLAAGENGTPPSTVMTATYRNRRFASVVPRPVFLGGRPVVPSLVQLPEQRLDNAPLLAGSPQLLPAPRAPAVTAIASAAPKVATAMRNFARMLERRPVPPAPRPAIMSARERGRLMLATARARAWAAHLPRPRPIAAAPPRPPHLATTTSRHLASR